MSDIQLPPPYTAAVNKYYTSVETHKVVIGNLLSLIASAHLDPQENRDLLGADQVEYIEGTQQITPEDERFKNFSMLPVATQRMLTVSGALQYVNVRSLRTLSTLNLPEDYLNGALILQIADTASEASDQRLGIHTAKYLVEFCGALALTAAEVSYTRDFVNNHALSMMYPLARNMVMHTPTETFSKHNPIQKELIEQTSALVYWYMVKAFPDLWAHGINETTEADLALVAAHVSTFPGITSSVVCKSIYGDLIEEYPDYKVYFETRTANLFGSLNRGRYNFKIASTIHQAARRVLAGDNLPVTSVLENNGQILREIEVSLAGDERASAAIASRYSSVVTRDEEDFLNQYALTPFAFNRIQSLATSIIRNSKYPVTLQTMIDSAPAFFKKDGTQLTRESKESAIADLVGRAGRGTSPLRQYFEYLGYGTIVTKDSYEVEFRIQFPYKSKIVSRPDIYKNINMLFQFVSSEGPFLQAFKKTEYYKRIQNFNTRKKTYSPIRRFQERNKILEDIVFAEELPQEIQRHGAQSNYMKAMESLAFFFEAFDRLDELNIQYLLSLEGNLRTLMSYAGTVDISGYTEKEIQTIGVKIRQLRESLM